MKRDSRLRRWLPAVGAVLVAVALLVVKTVVLGLGH